MPIFFHRRLFDMTESKPFTRVAGTLISEGDLRSLRLKLCS